MIFIVFLMKIAAAGAQTSPQINENHKHFDEISVKSTKHALNDFSQLLDRFLWYKSSFQTLSDTLGPKKWGPATNQSSFSSWTQLLPAAELFLG